MSCTFSCCPDWEKQCCQVKTGYIVQIENKTVARSKQGFLSNEKNFSLMKYPLGTICWLRMRIAQLVSNSYNWLCASHTIKCPCVLCSVYTVQYRVLCTVHCTRYLAVVSSKLYTARQWKLVDIQYCQKSATVLQLTSVFVSSKLLQTRVCCFLIKVSSFCYVIAKTDRACSAHHLS